MLFPYYECNSRLALNVYFVNEQKLGLPSKKHNLLSLHKILSSRICTNDKENINHSGAVIRRI